MPGKTLIWTGLALVAVGLALAYGPKVPFLGRLPGDIRIEGQNFRFYFPVTTCLLLSAVLALIFKLFK